MLRKLRWFWCFLFCSIAKTIRKKQKLFTGSVSNVIYFQTKISPSSCSRNHWQDSGPGEEIKILWKSQCYLNLSCVGTSCPNDMKHQSHIRCFYKSNTFDKHFKCVLIINIFHPQVINTEKCSGSIRLLDELPKWVILLTRFLFTLSTPGHCFYFLGPQGLL